MKKLMPIVFLLCMVGAWASVVMRGQGLPKEYAEYLQRSEAAYGQGYYVEALKWIQKAGEFSEGQLPYDAEQRKRDAYYNTGDMDSYAAQCRHMIESFPEQEENYVKLMEHYRDTASHSGVYKLIDSYVELWPENEALCQIRDEYDKLHEYFRAGYFDVRYAAGALIDVQRTAGKAVAGTDGEETGNPAGDADYVTDEIGGRELCLSRGNSVFRYGYSEMAVASDGGSCFVKDDKGVWTSVDSSNNLLAKNAEVSFDEIGKLSTSNIATAVIGGKIQFVNEKMQVSEIVWEDAGTFSGGINAVKKGGKWALVTEADWGSVSEFPYADVPLNSMGYCAVDGVSVVADQGGYYIVDTAKKNQPVTENRYEELKAFESWQPTAYRSGDKWGFVGKGGEVYIEAKYEDAMPYQNGYAAVKQDGLWGYVDQNGKMVVEPQFEEALGVMPDGVAYVKNELGSWDYIVIYKLYYGNLE